MKSREYCPPPGPDDVSSLVESRHGSAISCIPPFVLGRSAEAMWVVYEVSLDVLPAEMSWLAQIILTTTLPITPLSHENDGRTLITQIADARFDGHGKAHPEIRYPRVLSSLPSIVYCPLYGLCEVNHAGGGRRERCITSSVPASIVNEASTIGSNFLIHKTLQSLPYFWPRVDSRIAADLSEHT